MASDLPDPDLPDFDLTDDELRATGSVKWTWAPPQVLPAWVAEMDVRPCPAVQRAVEDAVRRGAYGYPARDDCTGVPEATAGFLARRFGWQVDPARVVLVGDVMAGVRIVLDTLCEDAPVVVPLPSYPPFLDIVPVTGRRLVTVPATTGDDGRATLDLGGIDAALAAGARTVLLSTPWNPLGRALTRGELEGLRDVALRHGARVVSDEIHAPLVLPGATHVPYLSLPGTAGHGVAVVASSKAFNTPGLKCAQVVAGSDADLAALRAVPHVANHGTASLGLVAARAAYEDGDAWLDGLLADLGARREQFGTLLAERLPHVRWTPPEATYLAWLDASATPDGDPTDRAEAGGGVLLHAGRFFGPGYERHARVNLATSAERLERVVDGLVRAWPAATGR